MSISATQQALVFYQFGAPIEEIKFATIETPKIQLPLDILVQVKAVAVNPVDLKVQAGLKAEDKTERKTEPQITGFDAAGIVVGVGAEVHNFKVGDEVYYSGVINRPGSYQQYQLVDHRIVALKPRSLSFEDAAALPLTSITAWEALKEEMRVDERVARNTKQGKETRILVHGGAGGVGSITIQLAKLWGLTVIATASRPETVKWCTDLGADEVVDHRQSLVEQFKTRNIAPVDCVFATFSEKPVSELPEIMNPGGVIVGINGDIGVEQIASFPKFFLKRISFHYEMMFARPLFNMEPERQGALLTEVAKLVDAGKVKSTVHTKLNWRQIHDAHHIMADHAPIGKIVLTVD